MDYIFQHPPRRNIQEGDYIAFGYSWGTGFAGSIVSGYELYKLRGGRLELDTRFESDKNRDIIPWKFTKYIKSKKISAIFTTREGDYREEIGGIRTFESEYIPDKDDSTEIERTSLDEEVIRELNLLGIKVLVF